jgi:DNA-binding NarL/FixJ family response regulator
MRINFATAKAPGDEPAKTFAAAAGGARDPKPAPLNISDTTIVVIEKRSLLRECLASCIASQSGSHVVTFPTVEAYLDASGAASASLVLLCQSTNPDSTTDVHDLGRLASHSPQLPVVVLSDGEDLQQICAAIDAGARGYIPTSFKLAVAVEALRLVRAGGVFVPATSVMAAPLQPGGGAGSGAEPGPTPAFTPRQAAVMEAIARGKANKLIARELDMCESTVKVHVRRIMKKLGAKNRTEVALIANGLPNSRHNGVADCE